MNKRLNPLEDQVGDLFVNRDYELNTVWEWATSIAELLPTNSRAILGRRRTGKTSILVKVFNRLFYEQEQVMPVFITFARYLHHREPINSYDFAREYFTGYIKCYMAFRYRNPTLLGIQRQVGYFHKIAKEKQDDIVLEQFDAYEGLQKERTPYGLVQWAINMPREIAYIYNIPTAVMVDEFQVLTKVHDPRQDMVQDLTDSFQWAADTRWAPLLVTGSAVSTLEREALGGMLSGRFQYRYLEPLSQEYTHDLVFRLGKRYRVETNEELAEAIWKLTAGYPYSIRGLMISPSLARREYPSLKALEEVLLFELGNRNGTLWQHYSEEFDKYTKLLNTNQITKKVMFWAAKYPEERIDAKEIAQKTGIDLEEIHTALRKLYQVDIIDRMSWSLYQGPSDPMLRRYIEYNYRQEIEELSHKEAMKDWQKEYHSLVGRVSNFMGEVAEVYVGGVMQAFDGREVEGEPYFNHPHKITLPVFKKVERRGGIVKKGRMVELDLIGEWTEPSSSSALEDFGLDEDFGSSEKRQNVNTHAWLVQVRYTKAPMGVKAVEQFLAQVETMKAEKKYTTITHWYFCKQGYTKEATEVLQKAGVLFSNLKAFNELAKLVGFFGLPK